MRARRKRHQTYPELGYARRCRLVVVGIEVGDRFGGEAVQLLRLLARHRAAAVPRLLRPSAVTASGRAGPGSWLSLLSAPSRPLSLSSPPPLSLEMAQSLTCPSSLPTHGGTLPSPPAARSQLHRDSRRGLACGQKVLRFRFRMLSLSPVRVR